MWYRSLITSSKCDIPLPVQDYLNTKAEILAPEPHNGGLVVITSLEVFLFYLLFSLEPRKLEDF